MTDIGLRTIAAQTPDRAAVIEPDGAVVSYAERAARADRLVRGLQALGLAPGATVAGMLPNGADALALFFAAVQTGLYVVPVNWAARNSHDGRPERQVPRAAARACAGR